MKFLNKIVFRLFFVALFSMIPLFAQESKPDPKPKTTEKKEIDWASEALSGLDKVIEQSKKEEAEAKERKLAEERNANVLVDKPEALVPLDQGEKIWITPDRTAVVILGNVCLREGLLEFFACVKGTKDHESIIALPIKPYLMHAGLLLVNAEPGEPAKFSPKFAPARGQEIDVIIRWKDETDKINEVNAKDWVVENESKQKMSTHWVFTGSTMRKLDDGKTVYLADVTGELIGLSNFPASIMDVPIKSSDSNESLLFSPNTKAIPKVGTQVTVLLKPVSVPEKPKEVKKDE